MPFKFLGIEESIELVSLDLLKKDDIQSIIEKYKPSEVYNLAAQSSVGLSFSKPYETLASNTISVFNILDILSKKPGIRLYHASSSEMFGSVKEESLPLTESKAFHPLSPYAVSKASAHWATINYRESYNLQACCGILFNHESALRKVNFVTKKIINTAIQIKNEKEDNLELGNLDIYRDWGYAPDYVEAMWLMLQQDKPEDLVIATGVTTRIRDFVRMCFLHVGIEVSFEGVGVAEIAKVVSCNNPEYQVEIGSVVVRVDPKYFRPTEVDLLLGDSSKAQEKLNWKPKFALKDLVEDMMRSDLHLFKRDKYLADGGHSVMDYNE